MTSAGRRSPTLLPAALALAFAVGALGAAAKNLAQTPQAKTYRALLAAVAAEDVAAYKKCMTKAAVAEIDRETKTSGLDAKKAMSLLKQMSPTDLELVALEVKGNKATMLATGKVFGQPNRATIDFERESGQWKVARQSWTNSE